MQSLGWNIYTPITLFDLKRANLLVGDFGLSKIKRNTLVLGEVREPTMVAAINFLRRFDMDGYVTGFGNPDWLETHSAATSTAPTVLAMLKAGATFLGRTFMDEIAYRANCGDFGLSGQILREMVFTYMD